MYSVEFCDIVFGYTQIISTLFSTIVYMSKDEDICRSKASMRNNFTGNCNNHSDNLKFSNEESTMMKNDQ